MISKIIDEELIQAAKENILDASKIVITTHVSPDGDAMGSSLALSQFLQGLGKAVAVIIPNDMPDFLKWLPGADDVVVYEKNKDMAEKLIAESDLIMALDFNELHRIEGMAVPVADAKAKKVLVDHHINPGHFADVVISYPEMTSTAEMVFRLICRMGYASDIDAVIGTCIYTGMMTDTGCFTYNSKSAEIYIIIAELIKKGINKDLIYQKVFYNFSENRYRLQGHLLSKKMKIYHEYGLSVMSLSKDEKTDFEFQKGDTEGFVNIPLSIKGVIFSVFFKEEEDKVKMSFRSVSPLVVNDIASELFGGGGHANAAGASSKLSLEETMKVFMDSLPKYKDRIDNALKVIYG
ncbi:MAG: DHH family phosphoesterase [Paludibacteraceae bacterium]|nr:DHH family phosphoesterase [Paludibacteraceae bacterium]